MVIKMHKDIKTEKTAVKVIKSFLCFISFTATCLKTLCNFNFSKKSKKKQIIMACNSFIFINSGINGYY